jgi:ubiquinone biosynthesis monooxygenase Coq7
MKKKLNRLDKLIAQFDQALRTCTPGAQTGRRVSPAQKVDKDSTELDSDALKHSAGLMRINHTGEVCAQALYHGQAMTAKLVHVRTSMEDAAAEEIDHLDWCEERLTDLDSRPSMLNPFFYTISFAIGAAAGIAGDKWSLGFVAETEKQVCNHLRDHLDNLPEDDHKSRAVLQQMIIDEEKHGKSAEEAGGAPLPEVVSIAMASVSRVMKLATYRF